MRRRIVFIVCVALLASACYRSFARRALDEDADAGPDEIDIVWDLPDLDVSEECHDRFFDVGRGRPDVLVLLDRSNSMCDGGYWGPSRNAISDIVGQWEDQIAFGLAVFPTRLCMTGSFQCISTTSVDVGVAPMNAEEIRSMLSSTDCCGGTPLSGSLEYVEAYFAGIDDGHAHHLMLVTDGAPNCNPELNRFSCTCTYSSPVGCSEDADSLNCLDDARARLSAGRLAASGVPVHVLGVAEAAESWSWVMDEIAEAGGTGSAVLAEHPEDVHAALEGIAGDVAPCRFEMDPGEVSGPDAIDFFIDGTPVLRDPLHLDGWDWVNSWTVDFYGPACELIVSGGATTVTARINC